MPFIIQRKEGSMQFKKQKRLHTIVLEFANGMTRSVKVQAVRRETAEEKAMKRNPSATGVKR